jgi:hypothetical protein
MRQFRRILVLLVHNDVLSHIAVALRAVDPLNNAPVCSAFLGTATYSRHHSIFHILKCIMQEGAT